LLLSCSARSPHYTAPPKKSTIVVTPIEVPVASPVAVAKPAPAPQPTVELARTTTLRARPSADAPAVGVIGKGARASVIETVAGADCTWIELAPRGWTCANATVPTNAPPTAAIDDDDDEHPIRGTYGYVRGGTEAFATASDAGAQTNGRALAGSNTVRAAGVIAVDGTRYWRTSQGDLIDASRIVQLAPSTFKGVAIDDAARMPAWVHARRDPYKPASLRAEPSARAKIVGELAPRTVVDPQEISDDGAFVRVDDSLWIARGDLRIATVATPPAGIGDDEKWFDVDRDEQVLVAYEGTRPVFATLVSTGKWEHETPTLVARIASKLESAVMASDKDSIYSVADVPWTMYYDRDFALHTAYWHDGFGGPRSHGCVNLAPRDARFLYRWSSPDVPPGWIAVYGNADVPGSIVRVRTHRDPEPAFRGYARDVRDRRSAGAAVASR
jgi:hypothetical protein